MLSVDSERRAGRRREAQIGAPRNGNPRLRTALVESATAAIRMKDTYLRGLTCLGCSPVSAVV